MVERTRRTGLRPQAQMQRLGSWPPTTDQRLLAAATRSSEPDSPLRQAQPFGIDLFPFRPLTGKSGKNTLFDTAILDSHSRSLHTPPTMINITPTQLRKAADIQEKIQSLQKELGQLLDGSEVAIEAPRKRRKVSAAGRARMRAAQIARWAKIKGTKAPRKRKLSAQGIANIRAGVRKRMMAQAKGKAVQKPRRKFSAAGRAALAAAARARWAKAKAAGKTTL